MRRTSCVLGVLLLSVSLLATASAADQQPYELNAITSQTGPAAFVGQSVTKTLAIIENLVNKQGGIRGRPLKFVINDDGSNPQNAVQIMSRLIAAKVPVVLGPGFVATCSATLPLTEKTGPVTWCTAPGIYPPSGSYAFVGGATTDDTVVMFVRYFRERGWSRIAVLTATDASGQAWDHGVAYAMNQPENRAVKIVAYEHMNPSDISVTAQMTRIKSADPQVLMVLPTGTPFGTAMRAVSEVGIDVPIGGGNGNVSYAQLKQYASFLPQQLYFPSNISLVPNAVRPGPIRDAQTLYFDAFREAAIKPDLLYNTAWDPAMIEISALRALGPTATGEQIRDYVARLHGWVGVNGVYDFRDGGQRGIKLNAMAVFRYDKDTGEFTAVTGPAGLLR